MGIDDGFAHTLILAGAFLAGMKSVDKFSELGSAGFIRIALMVSGLAMILVGIVDRIADHF